MDKNRREQLKDIEADVTVKCWSLGLFLSLLASLGIID